MAERDTDIDQSPLLLVQSQVRAIAARLKYSAVLEEEQVQAKEGIELRYLLCVTWVLLLAHISPIEWSNVILYGEYNLKREMVR